MHIEQPIRKRQRETARYVKLRWALGTLLDGQLEIFGAWIEADCETGFVQRVLHDLAARGVEVLRVFVINDVNQLPFASALVDELAGSPIGLGHPSVGNQSHAPLNPPGPYYALSNRQRNLIRRGSAMAQLLQESVERAVARHASFADGAAALIFVEEALRRAERRLRRPAKQSQAASGGSLAPPARVAGSALAMS